MPILLWVSGVQAGQREGCPEKIPGSSSTSFMFPLLPCSPGAACFMCSTPSGKHPQPSEVHALLPSRACAKIRAKASRENSHLPTGIDPLRCPTRSGAELGGAQQQNTPQCRTPQGGCHLGSCRDFHAAAATTGPLRSWGDGQPHPQHWQEGREEEGTAAGQQRAAGGGGTADGTWGTVGGFGRTTGEGPPSRGSSPELCPMQTGGLRGNPRAETPLGHF